MTLEELILIRGSYGSVNEFAVQNQIPNPMVYKWVNGTWSPTIKWIVKLATILQVEPHDVLYAAIATAAAHPKTDPLAEAIKAKKK